MASEEVGEDVLSAEFVLQGFVDDFRQDPFAEQTDATFGVKIRDIGEWYVEIKGSGHVVLKRGAVPVPAPFFITDMATLGRIERSELSILTSMGRANMSDKTPMDFGFANGFQLTPDTLAELLPLTFHFWTKGQPEIVEFGDLDQARVVHGAYATVFYYEKGLRTGYYRLEKGQHINADEEMQANPFPSLFILIGGAMESRIGGEAMTIEGRQAILVPAGVSHEFWNTSETPAEFIIVMFGDGA
jgi:mannose-6-phosphate isomerase-like protein (cupin superfamily)